MFLVVYFELDKQLECVNSKKVKKEDISAEFSMNDKVKVPYKTREIDDAGRERDVDVDYEGTIVYLSKDKSKVNLFMDKKKEAVDAILKGNINEFIKEFEKIQAKDGKRKGKKTSKMQSFMDEVAETSKTSETSKTQETLKISETSAKATPRKIRKTTSTADGNADSPSKNTRLKKTQNCSQETQRLQAMEYFKKKKAMQMEPQPSPSSPPKPSTPPRSLSPLPPSSPPSPPPVRALSPLPPAVSLPPLLRPCQTQPPQPQQTQLLPPSTQPPQPQQTQLLSPSTQPPQPQQTQLFPPSTQPPPPPQTQLPAASQTTTQQVQQFHPVQEHQSWDFPSASSLSNTTSVVAQSYSALLESPSSCVSCDFYKFQLDKKDEEIQRLQTEIDYLRTVSDRSDRQEAQPGAVNELLHELHSAIRKYENRACIKQQTCIHPDTRSEDPMHVDTHATVSMTPLNSVRSSAPLKTSSRLEDCGEDSLFTVNEHEEHFLPGENKVKLVQSYDLFIDATKLQAMKIKSKKNASKMLRDLLLYFFTPEYLATHSATGVRSSKKGLPLGIIQPVREFICSQFKCEDVNALINRKCLDISRSLKLQNKDKPA